MYVWILRPTLTYSNTAVKGNLEVDQELIREINEIYFSKKANWLSPPGHQKAVKATREIHGFVSKNLVFVSASIALSVVL